MNQDDNVLKIMTTAARHSPTAALITVGPRGLSSRLVHPLWTENTATAYLLTDGQSPKVSDLRRSSKVSLTYRADDLWLLVAADTSIADEPERVSHAIADCASRDEGYSPADFWNDEESARLVVVELNATSIEVARFNGQGLEVEKWHIATNGPTPS